MINNRWRCFNFIQIIVNDIAIATEHKKTKPMVGLSLALVFNNHLIHLYFTIKLQCVSELYEYN